MQLLASISDRRHGPHLTRSAADFHVRWFGLEVIFEADWIVVLPLAADAPAVAFMHSRHPTTPPRPMRSTAAERS